MKILIKRAAGYFYNIFFSTQSTFYVVKKPWNSWRRKRKASKMISWRYKKNEKGNKIHQGLCRCLFKKDDTSVNHKRNLTKPVFLLQYISESLNFFN